MKKRQGNVCGLLLATIFVLLLIQPVAAASWTPDAPMNNARYDHTATLLSDGRVLVAGGFNSFVGCMTNAELFNPDTGIWTNTAPLTSGRSSHTATLLQSGQVLVVGGNFGSSSSFLASAELYNPVNGRWTNAGSLHTGREFHTATLLPDGEVLVAGGFDGTNYLNSAELFNPATGQWTLTSPMNQARSQHTATLLADGTVLVTGGYNGSNSLAGAEVFNPATGFWTPGNPMNEDRRYHTATRLMDGRVLVLGGSGSNNPAKIAEIFDPGSGNWTTTGSTTYSWLYHTASLLPNGGLMVCGGIQGNRVELFDPVTETWTTNTAWMNVYRKWHTATMLPGGRVLVAGGMYSTPINNVEMYDYATGAWSTVPLASTNVSIGTLTLLPNGKVLAAGGSVLIGPDAYEATNSAQIYNPATRNWMAINPMNYPRMNHTATLLPDGKVLVAGGVLLASNGLPYSSTLFVTNSELFDPSSGSWTVSGHLDFPFNGHTATLLPNGKVLIAGGFNVSTNAELYDPATEAWTPTGSLNHEHYGHTATLLPNGKVLLAGDGVPELYDPASGIWSQFTQSWAAALNHTATLLPNGKVLIAGGFSANANITNCVLYDPFTGVWTNTGSMNYARSSQLATLLPNGKVLVAGMSSTSNPTLHYLSAELYDPASGTWTLTGSLNLRRNGKAVVLLPDGNVLVAGGTNLATAEIYDPGIGYTNTAQPQITAIASPLDLGGSLVITGAQFRGVSDGSGGNNSQGSATDYPLVQLRSLENGQTAFEPAATWGTNSFASLPVTGFPPGYAMATVFVNGIQSTSSIVNIGVQAPTLFDLHKISSPSVVTNGAYQFSLYYYAGAVLNVQKALNDVSQPVSSWPNVGKMTEISPGVYQFTDLAGKYNSKSFYAVHSQ